MTGKPSDTAVAATGPIPDRAGLAWRLVPVIGFVLIAGLFALALRSGDPSKLPSALIGKPAPRLVLPSLDGVAPGVTEPGKTTRPAVIGAGYPVLVNFYASWCAPCRNEHPLLVQLAQTTGVPILGINHRDTPAAGRRFIEQLGNPYERIVTDADGRAAIEWGAYGMPETFLVDGRGTVLYRHVGPLTVDVIERKILPVISAGK